jgi:hypothetical protein
MAMRTYETCLISMSGKVTVYLSALYFSDTAAIHAARGLCKHGELIQIWRDDVCIHSDGIGHLTRRVLESAHRPAGA